ncbi:serine hydrolase domain-containing protein [Marinoscillum pacificum]|uniref:serine hydrolase domain-containing protein n=1 Tax=Marinoscillum pacificum TaxID=392723 RepID=UPI0021571ECA|nr:serine hydrolase [Marinoscillum pacificum]
MHFLKSILYLISSFVVLFTYGKEGLLLSRVDSMYTNMSDLEKVSQLIWTQPTDANYTLNNAFGGIYYSAPITNIPANTEQSIAVQLDDRMIPLLDDNNQLPDLFTLATLQNSSLLSTYFHFLKAYSKGRGIDYLVLPALKERHSRLNLVIKQMNAHDPEFFILHNDLSFDFSKNKKKISEYLSTNSFWVVNEEEADQLEKKLNKHASNIMEQVNLDNRIKQHLINALYDGPKEQIQLPKKLSVEIGRESVIALSKKSLLPLKSDTVCFLSDEPYGAMANMLRNYSFVITEYQDIAKSHAIILIDNNAKLPESIDLTSRDVVFTGTKENLHPIKANVDAALIYHLNSEIYSYLIPQQIFGSHGATGIVPNQNGEFLGFQNEPFEGFKMLGYAPAEMTGLDELARFRIQEIIQEAISTGSTPGAQLAVAVDGSIILEEAYGYLTYDSLIPVDRSTIYDLASVTKVTSTLLATMKLYEEGKIDLDTPIENYLPSYKGSNKNHITIRALLSHNAGLQSYVPFWKRALNADFVEPFYYETQEDELNDKRSYGIKPTALLMDTLKNWIVQSSLLKYDSLPTYRYSDIGFMILHEIVESVTQQPMDQYLYSHYYEPMGLKRTRFKPSEFGFELFEIAPTEHDYYFRDELVWGEVHDRNAAIFGGVAGHAGLFSNAHELMILLQTILQDGVYGGVEYLKPETIAYFNQKFYENNRRALGWDKPDRILGNTSLLSSDMSFGHTGFTGTMIWIDPAYDMIFVFLSNRIYPNSNNYQLIKRNIRTRIQDVVYEALLAKWMN